VYHRYHLQTDSAPDVASLPSRFLVRVSKPGLAGFLLKEFVRYRGNRTIILSRPCMYGVFSGPVGGFAPREHLCVGCLRCTTQYPEFVKILPNPARSRLGDSYFTSDRVDTISYEADSGKIPVKGAGYRGPFGGDGWDSLWTDMSEIVRPTRDGIHGREFISTVIDIGTKPPCLIFREGQLSSEPPQVFSIPIPVLFDVPPASLLTDTVVRILAGAAQVAETHVVLPIEALRKFAVSGSHIVPLLTGAQAGSLEELRFEPVMLEVTEWDQPLLKQVERQFPRSVVCLRMQLPATDTLLRAVGAGVRVFHLLANYHGRGSDGRFAIDLFREAHKALVAERCRDEVTILGGGGISAAEHVPKAIICGCDGVSLDTPLLAALQAQFVGEAVNRETSSFRLPSGLAIDWGVQRITNLMASWRDQLLEVMGAMGLREVRRMRGEMGRAMLQKDFEDEAFSGIAGYAS
jgi:hypothetical protein